MKSDLRNQKAPATHLLIDFIDFSENIQTCCRVHDITTVINEGLWPTDT